jgi:hypothetical protein
MISLAGILAWFGTTIGRYAIIAGGLFAFIGAFMWQQQSVGARKERTKIINKANAEAKKRNAQASKIRNGIDAARAWERLRRDYADPNSN